MSMTGDYTIVQLQRQDELTRAIQGRMADAQKKQEEKANEAGESVGAAAQDGSVIRPARATVPV